MTTQGLLRSTLLLCLGAVAAAGIASAGSTPAHGTDDAPRRSREVRPVEPATPPALPATPGQLVDDATGHPLWIVMLDERPAGKHEARPAIDDSIDAVLAAAGIASDRPSHRYRHAIVGFAGAFSPVEAGRLVDDPRVVAVDADLGATLDRSAMPGEDRFAPPWGNRRISSPDGDAPELDRCGATGAGVTVVVIDSGINADHTEFGDRVRWSVDFSSEGAPDGDDVEGHGTGVASIAAGSTIGIAPEAWLAALRVEELDKSITNAAVTAALDWTVQRADELLPAVANLSLGGPALGSVPASYDAAFAAVERVGIPIFVAAGNEVNPASWKTPASTFFASTIGAIDAADHPTPFTNFGPFVDLWAPGAAILVADRLAPDGGFQLESGTSQATPMAAGVAALQLELHPPTTAELEVAPWRIAHRTRLALLSSAAEGVLSDRATSPWTRPGQAILGGGPNLLLQSCTRPTGLDPAPLAWIDGVASVRLGDGLTAIPLDFEHSRFVNHPDGPVEITLGLLGVPAVEIPDSEDTILVPGASVRIVDVADGRVLFDSDAWIQQAAVVQTMDRVVRSSTSAGVRIDWEPALASWPGMPDGVGYAMTANLVDPCPGDLNGDGSVDGADLPILLAAWGACPEIGPCIADLDGDGIVGSRDLAIMLVGWGSCASVPTRGYVFDCNEREVLANYLADRLLDEGDPLGRVVLAGRFGALSASTVDLDCESLQWDTNGGRFVVSPSDPRIGACLLPTGDCSQSSPFACVEGAFFGPGIPCDPANVAVQLIPTFGPDWLTVGYPWETIFPGDEFTRIRQPVSPGLFSISDAFITVLPIGSANSVGFRLDADDPDLKSLSGFTVPATPFRVVIEFTDGGPAAIVETTPLTIPVFGQANPMSTPFLSYRFGELLPSQSREIASIEFSIKPTGIAPASSPIAINQTLVAPADEGDPSSRPAEVSTDGGRSWSILRDASTGEPLTRGMAIIP